MRNSIMFTATALIALSLAGAGRAVAKADVHKASTKVETTQTEIPATSRYIFDRTVGPGRISKTGTGEPGIKTVKRTLYYVDGKLVKERTDVKVTKQPSDIVVAMGPAGYTKAGRSSAYVAKKVLTMSSSAYIANEGASNPTSNTATGRRCEFGIVAVDPRVIPLHSLMYIEGYGFGIAADTGGAIKGNKIDLCMDTRSQMNNWGRRKVQVHVLKTLTDDQLTQMGVKEGSTTKVVDDSLLAFSPNTSEDEVEAPMAAAPRTQQTTGGDPASTPGRDPNEPKPASLGNTAPPVKPTPTTTTPTPTPDVKGMVKKTANKDVNVRMKPSAESTIVAIIFKGQSVSVGAGSDGWYPVVTATGTRGYIRGDSIGMDDGTVLPVDPSTAPKVDSTAKPPKSTPMVVRKDDVSLRSKPSTDGDKVTSLKAGTKVTMTGEENGWYKVQLEGGETGYIRKDMFEATPKKSSNDEDPAPKKVTPRKRSNDEEPAPKKSTRKKSNDEEPAPKKSSNRKSSNDESSSKKSSHKSSDEGSSKKSSHKKSDDSSSKKSTHKKVSTNDEKATKKTSSSSKKSSGDSSSKKSKSSEPKKKKH